MAERRPGEEDIHADADRFLPDDERPGSDMGAAYDEAAGQERADDDPGDEGGGMPGVGDVYRSGS